MTPHPDEERLLERLSRGEVVAAEELFTTYAPYLRAVVRGHLSDRLRAKYDSADVVQSVWVQVVRRLREDGWRLNTEAELRALLVTVARRRAISRARHHAPAAGREQSLEQLSKRSWPQTNPARVRSPRPTTSGRGCSGFVPRNTTRSSACGARACRPARSPLGPDSTRGASAASFAGSPATWPCPSNPPTQPRDRNHDPVG